MTIIESLARFTVARHDGGRHFPLSPAGDRAWEAEMDAAEEALKLAKPQSVHDVTEILSFIEREVSQDPNCGVDMITAMLANCREFLGRVG